MDYGSILSRAWQIVWKNKFLIILGFLAALGGGTGGSNTRGEFSWQMSDFGEMNRLPSRVGTFIADNPGVIAAVAVLFVFIGIVLWLVRLASEAGMIESVDRLDLGESLNFGAGFGAGVKHLGGLVGLNLLLYGPLILLGIIGAVLGVSAALSAAASRQANVFSVIGLFLVCLVPLGCLVAVYVLLVTFVYPFAQRGIVLKHLGVMDSVGHGWKVLTGNIGHIIVLVLIFVVLGIIVGGIAALIAIPFGVGALLPTFINLARDGTVSGTNILVAALGVILVGLLAAIIGSALRAYQSATFTLAYKEFIGTAVKPAPPPEAEDAAG